MSEKLGSSIVIDGVEYVRKEAEAAPAKPVITMDTEVYCLVCGKKLQFGSTYSPSIKVRTFIYKPHMCKVCMENNGNDRA